MIKASVAQARWVGGNRHKGCITTEILLHDTDRTLQAEPKRRSKSGKVVELQCAYRLTEPALIGADPCPCNTARRRGAALHPTVISKTKLFTTLGAEQRPLDAAGAATLRGEER